MKDRKFQKLFAKLAAAPVSSPGVESTALRQAICARAAALGGWPLPAAPGVELPPAVARYADKVAREAYAMTDDDVAALRRAGYPDDAIFEITLCAALGAGRARLERGLAALEGRPAPPAAAPAPSATSATSGSSS
jgi:hypothetical protein